MSRYSQRAPFNDWWYWGETLVKRFRTASEIYRDNGEMERAADIGALANRLKENFIPPVVAARKGMKTDAEKQAVQQLEEEAIFNSAEMYREILANFPFMSSAIQDFLNVAWQDVSWDIVAQKSQPDEDDWGDDDFEGKLLAKEKKGKGGAGDIRITELFWGPKERQDEGIRSGKIQDGGLPGILYNLLIAERSNSSRSPTDYGKALQVSAFQQKAGQKMAMGKP